MFDHLSLGVTNLERSLTFYDAVLAPLGIKRLMNFSHASGYGTEERPMFWIGIKEEQQANIKLLEGFHLAFQADNQKVVDDFYAVAISAGAKDNGKPGLRPRYHPSYYAAFVFDPDGYLIEAVCHKPE